MKEQSDTPRQTPLVELLLAVPEDARLIYEHSPTESQSIPVGPMCRQAAMELATATRERDEWKLAARNQAQIVTKIARERDEARAEVERLRAELFFVLRGDGLEHLYDGDCPASNALHARDPECPACKRLDELAATEAARKFCGVGELERAGYIPAGSADERET